MRKSEAERGKGKGPSPPPNTDKYKIGPDVGAALAAIENALAKVPEEEQQSAANGVETPEYLETIDLRYAKYWLARCEARLGGPRASSVPTGPKSLF